MMQAITVIICTGNQRRGFHKKEKKKWRPYYESLNTDASHKKHLILSKRATQRQISVVLTDNTGAAPLFQNERKHTKEPSSQSQALQRASGL